MVFKTVVENIKSFVAHEEELLQEPKKVPDAASEVLGSQKIVAQKPLPTNSSTFSPQEPQKPKLAFSAKDLLEARQAQKQETPPSVAQAPARGSTPEPEFAQTSGMLDDEVRAFEEAMNSIHTDERLPEPAHNYITQDSSNNSSASLSVTPSTTPRNSTPPSIPSSTPSSLASASLVHSSEPGFFSSFEEFLTEEGIDERHFDGDLLHKMREYHERQSVGKEPLSHQSSATDAVGRKLRELQSLESEWQHLFMQSHDIERSMVHIEEEIQERTSALKTLLEETKKLSFLAKEVSAEHAFVLANGTKVQSLGSLIRILQKDSWLYDAHVRDGKNDFAAWVAGAFENPELSRALQETSSFADFLKTLRDAK